MMRWAYAFFEWISDPNNLTAISTAAIAAFTIVLAAVGYFQARLTRKSIDLARDQISLARKEFISTHRPKLRARLFTLHPLTNGEPITVQYEVVNVGDSGARVVRCETDFRVGAHPLPLLDSKSVAEGRVLAAGSALLISAASKIAYDKEWTYLAGLVEISGTILYRDDNGIERRTAFYRATNTEGGLWRPDSPDHNYED